MAKTAAARRGRRRSTATTEFSHLLLRLSEKYSSQREFARAIGVDATRLNRAINGGEHMFDVLRCMYLAEATREDPLVVLRAAGKDDLANVIGRLFGKALDAREQRVLRAFRNLSDDTATALLSFFDEVIAVGGPVQHHAPPPRRVRRRRLAVVKQRFG